MVANVKKTKSPVFLTILAVLVVLGVLAWQFLFQGRGYDETAVAHVDGTIDREASEVTLALEQMNEAEAIPVIRDGANTNTRVAILLMGVSEDTEMNRQLISILNEKGIRYSYALSAAEGMEDEDFIATLDKNLVPIVSNGALGEANLQNQDEEKMIQSLLKSRTVLSAISKQPVSYVYCNASNVNADLLWAASVSGYDALISASQENVLDESAFGCVEEAKAYVQNLSGDNILVCNLRGRNEEVTATLTAEVSVPAVDLQPKNDENETVEIEDIPFETQVEWLMDAIVEKEIDCVYLSDFTQTEGIDVLKQHMNDADATKAPVYHTLLTDQAIVGFGLYGLSQQSDEAISSLQASALRPSVFVTPEEIETQAEVISGMSFDFGIAMSGIQKTITDDELFDLIRQAKNQLCAIADFNRILLADENCDNELLQRIRLLANVMNLNVVQPSQTMEASGLYVTDKWDLSGLHEIQNACKENGLSLRSLGDAVNSKLTIATLSLAEEAKLRNENNGVLSEEMNLVHTTERTIGFAFYNLGTNDVIRDTVNRMNTYNASGTYFVTLDELMNKDTAIETILESGNELGIAYNPNDTYPQTYDAVMNYLNTWQRYASWRFGITATTVLMPNCTAAQESEEAIHTMHCALVKATYLPVKDEDRNVSADDISSVRERLDKLRFMRGSFVCFNLGFYENDQTASEGNSVAGQVLSLVIEDHVDSLAYRNYATGEIEDDSRFTVACVSDVLNSKETYELNSSPQTTVAMDKNALETLNASEQFDYMCERYYGNVTVDTYEKLPGFSASEVARLDKQGILTEEPVLFLTFDDWGTEETLNALLYVLDKYNVKATFFVRTGYVDSNPNLLRTIASHGHLIAAHSDQHLALANNVTVDGNLTETISEEEAAILREDLVTCYNKLYGIVGDYEVDGKAALKPYFRPPTLAVSRLGLFEVFDVGYTYSLSGGYSTGDYAAESFDDMVDRLTARSIGNGQYVYVTNGTMVVLHMQENAKYTAQALDYMIPIWQAKGYSFARVDDYLK